MIGCRWTQRQSPTKRSMSEIGILQQLSTLFLVGFHMVSKQFTVGRIGDTVEMNFDSCFTEFRAEVDDLNIPTALDCHASRYADHECRN